MTLVAAFVQRDFGITRSYRFAVMLELALGLMNLLVYFFISRTFKDVPASDLAGAPSYFAFAAVGIAMTTVIDAASAGIAVSIREEQLTGTLEAVVTQPVSPLGLAVGMSGLPFVGATVRAAIYLFLATVLLDLDIASADWGGAAAVLGMSALALSSLGIASGAMVLLFKRADVIAGFGAFAMGLLSGSVFPISVLPDWLRPIGEAMPTRFAFDGLRAALFTGKGWGDDVLALSLFAAVLVPAALWAFAAALKAAKRAGSIAEY